MASNIIHENVELKVTSVTKRGKEGSYNEKVVNYKDKNWTVSKNDKDSVKVGETYTFNLSKSEYNDKLYYWANLVKSEDGDKSSGKGNESNSDFKKQVFGYLDGLSKENKIATIEYLLKRI